MHLPVHGQTFPEETADHGLLVKAGEDTHRTGDKGPVGALLHVVAKGVQDFWHLNGRRAEGRAQCILYTLLQGPDTVLQQTRGARSLDTGSRSSSKPHCFYPA